MYWVYSGDITRSMRSFCSGFATSRSSRVIRLGRDAERNELGLDQAAPKVGHGCGHCGRTGGGVANHHQSFISLMQGNSGRLLQNSRGVGAEGRGPFGELNSQLTGLTARPVHDGGVNEPHHLFRILQPGEALAQLVNGGFGLARDDFDRYMREQGITEEVVNVLVSANQPTLPVELGK